MDRKRDSSCDSWYKATSMTREKLYYEADKLNAVTIDEDENLRVE